LHLNNRMLITRVLRQSQSSPGTSGAKRPILMFFPKDKFAAGAEDLHWGSNIRLIDPKIAEESYAVKRTQRNVLPAEVIENVEDLKQVKSPPMMRGASGLPDYGSISGIQAIPKLPFPNHLGPYEFCASCTCHPGVTKALWINAYCGRYRMKNLGWEVKWLRTQGAKAFSESVQNGTIAQDVIIPSVYYYVQLKVVYYAWWFVGAWSIVPWNYI